MRSLLLLAALLISGLSPSPSYAGGGTIRGRVLSALSHEPLAYADVTIPAAQRGTRAADDGTFTLTDLAPGRYNVQVNLLGYKRLTLFELDVTNVLPVTLEVLMDEDVVKTDSVSVTASPFRRTAESPVSVRSIGESEIQRFPGGDRDISKVLQGQPGVAPGVSFRNDIIVRGGAPNENRFFLDGIEVPNINHFATQGSSGGPVGMIDVAFIRDVDLFTSAFPAARGNALSSVLDFRMKDGNSQRAVRKFTVGASDAALAWDGPLGRNTTGIVSLRRSYLQFVFKLLDLPFLPTYNDLQFKTRTRLGAHDEVELLGLGAIDRFKLNPGAKPTELNQYLLGNIPVSPQWSYSAGGAWRHFEADGVRTLTVSRNQLDNRAYKYKGNDESSRANLLLDYRSRETEHKLRLEQTKAVGAMRLSGGVSAEAAEYTNSTYEQTVTPSGLLVVDFASKLRLARYALFAQASRSFAREALTLSAGLRTDASDYSREMSDPGRQLSPRLAASLRVAPRLTLNASVGRYFQLPAYTVLGYRDSNGVLANRASGTRWIRAEHAVAGLELTGAHDSRVTLEGFYKRYHDYPFLLRDSVSLANLGADFGVIGNAPVAPASQGRAYGVEFLAQQKLYRGYYGILAYTFVRSEFTTRDGVYAPSAWDNRHLLSFTGGKRWGKGWELGARWRYTGGAPYTPDNVELSSRTDVWDASGRGKPDYARLNTLRGSAAHQLDLRLDRSWFRANRTYTLYIDIQNAYGSRPELKPILLVQRDANGKPVLDPQRPGHYRTYFIKDDSGGETIPTIGFTMEF